MSDGVHVPAVAPLSAFLELSSKLLNYTIVLAKRKIQILTLNTSFYHGTLIGQYCPSEVRTMNEKYNPVELGLANP